MRVDMTVVSGIALGVLAVVFGFMLGGGSWGALV